MLSHHRLSKWFGFIYLLLASLIMASAANAATVHAARSMVTRTFKITTTGSLSGYAYIDVDGD